MSITTVTTTTDNISDLNSVRTDESGRMAGVEKMSGSEKEVTEVTDFTYTNSAKGCTSHAAIVEKIRAVLLVVGQ